MLSRVCVRVRRRAGVPVLSPHRRLAISLSFGLGWRHPLSSPRSKRCGPLSQPLSFRFAPAAPPSFARAPIFGPRASRFASCYLCCPFTLLRYAWLVRVSTAALRPGSSSSRKPHSVVRSLRLRLTSVSLRRALRGARRPSGNGGRSCLDNATARGSWGPSESDGLRRLGCSGKRGSRVGATGGAGQAAGARSGEGRRGKERARCRLSRRGDTPLLGSGHLARGRRRLGIESERAQRGGVGRCVAFLSLFLESAHRMQASFFLAVALAAAGALVRDGSAAAGDTVMEFRALCRLATALDAFKHLEASALWRGQGPVTQIEGTLNKLHGGGGGKGHAHTKLGRSSVVELSRRQAEEDEGLRGKHAPREAKGRDAQDRTGSTHCFAKLKRPKHKRRSKSARKSVWHTKLCGAKKVVR
ncbi:hypothetical protein, conserved in T. vivax [Trypanosoma vivax Y486]|uniref:Uncharacterized protein n=1 Tax=Trypanosoma vivax (strain Y486) TaxID=1055687 RepID=F9WUU8_TRYVY|nr:hypothetical protein, conserved in T. vivax [Trypanosoma vivax Y486]|eukprot:CCD21347.1 hypothetical protein, conserved in T. vivax [Trypanosoma vivax Y486]